MNITSGYIAILLLFISPLLSAQENSTDTFYREDQLYLGINYLIANSTAEEFFQEGLSSQLQIGMIRDIPISKSGRWAIGAGVGYERVNLRNNLQWDFQQEQARFIYAQQPSSFSYQSLALPLELRWRSSTPTKYAFWRVYGGVKWNRNWTVEAEYRDLLKAWVPTAYLSFGYNTWNVQLAYALRPLYDATVFSTPTDSLRLVSFGLVFYLF